MPSEGNGLIDFDYIDLRYSSHSHLPSESLLIAFRCLSHEKGVCRMSENNYEYHGESLSVLAAMDILKVHYTTDEAMKTGSSIKGLMSLVDKYHQEHGGLPTDSDNLKMILTSALDFLSKSGRANEISKDHWRLPKSDQRIFGSGEHWVYLYYFDQDKNTAESQGKGRWRCRVGRATSDPEGRITRPTKGTPVPPRGAILFRTDKWVELEGAIHRTLKLRGRHLEKLQGVEWFNTTPDEVVEIYDFIIHRRPNYTSRQELICDKQAKRWRDKGFIPGFDEDLL